MDGNGRWARARGKPRHAGHRAGVESVRRVIEACGKRGVKVLSLFAFSSENWRRPETEVKLLMELFFTALNREIKRLVRSNVRLRILGDVSAFSDRLQALIQKGEQATAENDGLLLQVCANYGGRWDITQAARRLAGEVQAGRLDAADIDEERLAGALSFAGVPDPDLLIRTAGEQRISNFMLWQCAYTELYFTEILWPDFDQAALDQALADYARRQRRFGRVPEEEEG